MYISMKKGFSVLLLICFFLNMPLAVTAQAAESDNVSQPSHLIQTVTEQDLYEGLLALGFLECPVLEDADMDLAYENAKKCVVGIHMKGANGSGIILQMTPEQIVIASNRHVLDYWEDDNGYIQFYQGYIAEGRLTGVSDRYDVGFLSVDNGQLGYQALQSLFYACYSQTAYRNLRVRDEIFCIGGKQDETGYYAGIAEDLWVYIEELEGYMMQADGIATPGMSGGGTFDTRGNLVGMITGASERGKTASVPLPVLLEAYEEVSSSWRLE